MDVSGHGSETSFRFRGTSDALKDSLLPEGNFVDSNELFMSQVSCHPKQGLLEGNHSRTLAGRSESILPLTTIRFLISAFTPQFDEQLQSMIKESREEAETGSRAAILASQSSRELLASGDGIG